MFDFNLIRPSTLLCIVEDGVIGTSRAVGKASVVTGKAIANETSQITHATKIEYRARQLAKAQELLASMDAALASATDGQKVALVRDEIEITTRTQEILAKRAQS